MSDRTREAEVEQEFDQLFQTGTYGEALDFVV
jgi:hypothetical protein